MLIDNNTVLCTSEFVKRVELMLKSFTTNQPTNETSKNKDARKLLEMLAMFIILMW